MGRFLPNQGKTDAFRIEAPDKLLDIRTIEKWLNMTLQEAKYYDIKPAILNVSNAFPMQNYGVD